MIKPMVEFMLLAITVLGINSLLMQAFFLIMCCFRGFREQFGIPEDFWTMDFWTRPLKLKSEYTWDTTTNSGTTIVVVPIVQRSETK